ncbi:MAG: hypothetical protein A2725_00835 [Candidatus Magasanikbacteria bacterium RIFCSPHIGHO2_01_FULL_33_34]|uniref:Glycosyl transferase family 1 domain-containing protein n=1 Tax=Candidatus Magasanikbacteria bacterium RIFCSPHIGHO2_01_FULL_33_34 TaxID=1798671 RepID=A0A1F6LIY4_9BACT|nr:MAG: hypothetical protein A2725_00835 [Candidatus Magasanikbacteria bacterium RIFCSPHIGHO2_01_FULL_33_34]OGH65302.1 MAG: hypothetical protein A3B83_04495 [Candidatus Magasanikbacteria bacterium RIFCSPHIGHO2_02_FULL_33_17]OGH76079.1 MAG: hypothetical protein A3A89_01420 [Candidatus Magasanikbacteria bacterium RIFCSPLOWO2_01_FULL_33_34]OGH81750.1 MAG: hypothetical protein A3F93_00740 [Candidatus Magasanikbacteria bacterium RIFCSPLOWO2_12_FULL_34_7]
MNYKLTIGIDASRANNKNKTGVEWYAWHLIQNLKKINISSQTGKDVQFVLYSREKLEGEIAELPSNWSSKVLYWPPKRFWTQIRLSYEMLINPPDVLFVPAHVFPIVRPRKTVMTIHDIAALRFPKSYSVFQRFYTIWSAKIALKKLWKIIVPSNFTKNELLSLKTEQYASKIKVLYHGYDERYNIVNGDENIANILKKYNIKQPYILSIGRLEEKKNTKRIVQAFNHIAQKTKVGEMSLVLVGLPGYGYNDILKTINKSQYKEKIISPGYVEPEDLRYILKGAEVFVFPSLCEGFGLPVLDAMASGVSVVASSGSSLEEIGSDACLYVDPQDVWDIAKTISTLLDNTDICKKQIQKGMVRVKDFSWDKCAEETLVLLMSA